MLPKSRRIPREIFKSLSRSRNSFHSQNFLLRVAPSLEARIAVSVPKKVSKKAVIRNKLRRRIYLAIRELFSTIKPGLYSVIAKPGAEKIKNQDLKDELSRLIRSIRN